MRGAYYLKISDSYLLRSRYWFYASVVFEYSDVIDVGDWIVVYDYDGGNGLIVEVLIKSMSFDGSKLVVSGTTYELEYLKDKNVYLNINVSGLKIKKSLTSVDEVSFKMPLGLSTIFELGDVFNVYISGVDKEYVVCRVGSQTIKKDGTVEFTAYGSGYELMRIYVRKVYYDTAPEEIVRDLVESNTNMKVVYVQTGDTLRRFVVDDYIYNAITFLAEGYKYQIRIVGDTVYFEPFGYIKGGLLELRDLGAYDSIKRDLSKLVNELWLYGDNVIFLTSEEFIGDGNNNVFTVLRPISGSVKILINGNEVDSKQYSVKKEEGRIELKFIPNEGDNITVWYEYTVPIVVHMKDESSIAKYGKRGRKITSKFIDSFEKARDYAYAYLREFADPTETIKVTTTINKMLGFGIEVGKEYRVKDDLNAIDEEYVVTGFEISDNGVVNIEIGERSFDIIDWNKKVEERIAQLEKLIEAKIVLTEYMLYTESMLARVRERFRMRAETILGEYSIDVSVRDRLGLLLSGISLTDKVLGIYVLGR